MRSEPVNPPPPVRFGELLTDRTRSLPARELRPGECQTQDGVLCRLCHASRLQYSQELEAKQSALEQFARDQLDATPLAPLIPSPEGRGYRTTTKRKMFQTRRGWTFGLIDPDDEGKLRGLEVQECVIEPPVHGRLYRVAGEFFRSPEGSSLASRTRHVVIRGGPAEQTLILTVDELSAAFRSATRLSKMLGTQVPSLVGGFLYEDTTRGSHYLGTRGTGAHVQARKLFGKAEIFLRVLAKPFLFSPFVFSQVNPLLVERMILTVADLLEPDPRGMLYDLYCGYGLFALSLADRFRGSVGMEVSALSVGAARRNAERQRAQKARFQVGEITPERIGSMLRGLRPADRVLLDPPRNGAGPGVIEAIAARRPRRAVHIVCNIDLLGRELRRWKEAGYRVVTAVPLDMFPGTSTIETVVALERS